VEVNTVPGPEPIQPDEYYHIYNRGTNGETLFRERRNYPYFLKFYAKYVEPVAETFAYCLLKNHFHFLVRIKEPQTGPVSQTGPVLSPSRQLNHLFIAYAKAFNKAYGRTGALFESPFKRKRVASDRYFAALVIYIHRNPQKHGLVKDFRRWLYSSYRAVLSSRPTRVQRDTVLAWFDGPEAFVDAHLSDADEAKIESLIVGDH
jgi:putative transposase